ncbi:MAG: beta-ribofuranosylaminobenzene 5'-phosphate synthase family protein [Parvibaculaceae bacterium]
MSRSVTVTVPARLHLGFLDIDGSLGRRFGSIGLSIDSPVTRVTISRAARDVVEGCERARAARYLETMRQALQLEARHHLVVEEASPPHAGLGSGTQIALAVATALRKLHALSPDVRGDAERLGRGGRSGVGIGLFEQGGVVLDGGRTDGSGPAPILVRLPFPEAWRILLISDPAADGIHGERELNAFADLKPFPEAAAAHLCHLVVLGVLPALIEQDIGSFGDGVTEIQAVVGDWFASAQGGRFASARVAASMEKLAAAGARGIGQSSWGPTGFAFAQSQQQAERLAAALTGSTDIDCRIVRGNNRGAVITSKEAAAIA